MTPFRFHGAITNPKRQNTLAERNEEEAEVEPKVKLIPDSEREERERRKPVIRDDVWRVFPVLPVKVNRRCFFRGYGIHAHALAAGGM